MEKQQEVMEILVTLNEYLDKLIPAINGMVNNFYEGNESFAFENLTEICDGLNWTLRVLEVTQDITKLHEEVESLKGYFTEIVEALENQDYILVSDLFNYEIKELFVNVKNAVKEVVAG